LGAWAWPVNVLGLVWGVGAIADMLQPAGGDQPWFAAWGMALTFAAVIVSGLAYMALGRPYDRSASPAGDAWHR
ncbi:hypothetical protein ACKI1Q_45805, partial [Streptomyces galilaeus]